MCCLDHPWRNLKESHMCMKGGLFISQKRETMEIIKTASCWPGLEHARRSPSVESVYRRPGFLRRESLVPFLRQFRHSQLWRFSGPLPCRPLCGVLRLVSKLLTFSRVWFLSLCWFITCLFFPQKTRDFQTVSQKFDFEMQTLGMNYQP